jgi:hypothetical protein
MDLQEGALLTLDDLRGLAGEFGRAVSPVSPLAAGADTPVSTRRKPALDGDDWRAAMAVLAAPDRFVSVATPIPGAVKIASYYARGDEMAACVAERDGFRVSFPWTIDAIVEDAREALLADLPLLPDTFTTTLSPAGLSVLMAAVDLQRATLLAAMLERRIRPDFRFEVAQLQEQLDQGLAADDSRWMVTFLRLLAPLNASPTPDDLAIGLAELAAAQLITLDRKQWSPAAPLLRLVSHWGSAMPAVAHQLLTLDSEGAIEHWRHRIAIRGQGPIWVIDYDGLVHDKPAATLRSVYGSVYLRGLKSMLSDPARSAAVNAPESSAPETGARRRRRKS